MKKTLYLICMFMVCTGLKAAMPPIIRIEETRPEEPIETTQRRGFARTPRLVTEPRTTVVHRQEVVTTDHTETIDALIRAVEAQQPAETLIPLLQQLKTTQDVDILVRRIANRTTAENMQKSIAELNKTLTDLRLKIDSKITTAKAADLAALKKEREDFTTLLDHCTELANKLAKYIENTWIAPEKTILSMSQKLKMGNIKTVADLQNLLFPLFNSDNPIINTERARALVETLKNNPHSFNLLQINLPELLEKPNLPGPLVKALFHLQSFITAEVARREAARIVASAPSSLVDSEEALYNIHSLFEEVSQIPVTATTTSATEMKADALVQQAMITAENRLLTAQVSVVKRQLAQVPGTEKQQAIVKTVGEIATSLRNIHLAQFGILRPFIAFLYLITDWFAAPGERDREILFDALVGLNRWGPFIKKNDHATAERLRELLDDFLAMPATTQANTPQSTREYEFLQEKARGLRATLAPTASSEKLGHGTSVVSQKS